MRRQLKLEMIIFSLKASRPPPRPIKFDRLCLLLIICVYLSVCTNERTSAAADEASSLPSLWSSVSSGAEKAYHVVYNLETAREDQMLTIEEWASYERQLFRMDLIMGTERKSYLFLGDTEEIFRYEPFVCHHLNTNDKDFDFIKRIFLGYDWNHHQHQQSSNSAATNGTDHGDQPFMVYGLGPLWLRARQDLIESKYLPFGRYEQKDDKQFEGFEVTVKKSGTAEDGQDRLRLRFFFAKGEYHFVDTLDWVRLLEDGENAKILARLKVLNVDFRAPDEAIFKLPIGHGCKHQGKLDLELQMDVGLVLLHQGVPNQVVFNVIASQPLDDLAQSWSSQKYSMRMMRHSRSRRDDVAVAESYYVTLMQFRSPDDGKLMRTKRVWWAPNGSQGQATVYEINQETGNCRVDHREVRDQIILGYLDAGALVLDPSAKPAVLSVDQISYLFADSTDYHLIDEGEPLDQGEFNNRYFEKRVNNFKLTTEGQVTWQGPVSIVKRISSYWQNLFLMKQAQAATAQRAKLSLWSNYQTTLTIFFYSQDYTKLVYKVVIELLGKHEVSYAYVHEQLDVSTCFNSDDDDGDRASQVVSVKYPIESTKLLKKLEEKEEAIRSALFANLFEPPMSSLPSGAQVVGLGGFLSPLQISNVQLSFDTFNAHLKLTVLDVPLSQLFQLNTGYKLEASGDQVPTLIKRSSLMETTSSSAASCAQHCEHYNCLRFSYEPSTRACNVELIGANVQAVESPGAELYTYYDRLQRVLAVPLTKKAAAPSEAGQLVAPSGDRPHLSAASIVEYLEAAVLEPLKPVVGVAGGTSGESSGGWSAADSENWPLVLSINLRPHLRFLNDDRKNRANIVTMKPESISHDLDTMNEYVRELRRQDDEPAAGKVVRLLDGGDATRLKLQYGKFLENRRFISADVGWKLDGQHRLATYEQCEQFCETNDCRSFQYCHSDESCIVSPLTEHSLAAPLLTKLAPPTDECNIYLLDYLSKFEHFGSVPAPNQKFVREFPNLQTPRSCATVCMGAQDNAACQGFYHCRTRASSGSPKAVDQYTCYTTTMHVTSLRGTERELVFGPAKNSGQQDPSSPSIECSYYSRSYLAQFDKYRGKSLDIAQAELSNGGGGAHYVVDTVEQCAQRCIELDCLAFDSCPAKEVSKPAGNYRGGVARESCTLLLNYFQKSHLKPETKCTTFVLSDKSQFNKRGTKLILDSSSSGSSSSKSGASTHLEPDQKAAISVPDDGKTSIVSDEEITADNDVGGPGLELLQIAADEKRRWSAAEMLHDASNTSHWLARLFSFSIGTISGCLLVVAWNEAYARGWLSKARRGIASAASWRRF